MSAWKSDCAFGFDADGGRASGNRPHSRVTMAKRGPRSNMDPPRAFPCFTEGICRSGARTWAVTVPRSLPVLGETWSGSIPCWPRGCRARGPDALERQLSTHHPVAGVCGQHGRLEAIRVFFRAPSCGEGPAGSSRTAVISPACPESVRQRRRLLPYGRLLHARGFVRRRGQLAGACARTSGPAQRRRQLNRRRQFFLGPSRTTKSNKKHPLNRLRADWSARASSF